MAAKEGATAQFAALSQELQRAAFHFGGMVTAAGALGKSVGSFRELEKQLVLTNSVASGTAQELQKMEVAVRNFALASSAGAAEAGSALYFLSSAGFSVRESMQAMTGVLLLAQATLEPIGEASDVVASNIRAFGLEASDATRVTNTFVAAISQSQASLPKLSFAFRQVAPVAKVANLSIEETTAALGVLFNVGLRGEQAGTALRNIIVRLASPVGEAEVMLKKLNIATTNTDGSMRNLHEVLKDIAAENLAESQLATLFGTEALAGGLALLESTSGAWKELQENITDTQRAFQVANDQLNTLNGSMTLAGNALTEIGISVGDTLAPVIREVADVLVNLAIEWRGLDDATRRYVLTLGTMVIAGGLAVKTLISLARFLVPVVTATLGFKTAVDALTLAMIGRSGVVFALGQFLFNMSPLGRVLTVATAGLVALGGAAAGMSYLVDEAKDFAKSISGAFGDETLEPLQTFATKFRQELQRIRLAFSGEEIGAFDQSRATADLQKQLGLSLEEQNRQIAALKERLDQTKKDMIGLQEAGKSLQGALDFGYLFGFGESPLVSRLKSEISNTPRDAQQISDLILKQFAGIGSDLDLASLKPELRKQYLLIQEFFKTNESVRTQILETVKAELAKGSNTDEIVAASIAQVLEQNDNLPLLKKELENRITKASVDASELERLQREAQELREQSTEKFIDFLRENALASRDKGIRENADAVKAFLAEDAETLEAIRKALNEGDKPVSLDLIVQTIKENIDKNDAELAEAVRTLEQANSKRFVVLDSFADQMEKDIRQVARRAREAQAEIERDFSALFEISSENIQQNVFDKLEQFSDTLTKAIEGEAIFEKLKTTGGFDPALIDALAGRPILQQVGDRIIEIQVSDPNYEAVRQQKVDFLLSLAEGTDDKELVSLITALNDRRARLLENLEKEAQARIESDRRRIFNDAVKDARAREDFFRQIEEANIETGLALAKLAPDNFPQMLAAESARINAAYEEAILKIQRDIEDEQREGRLDSSIADQVRTARTAAAGAERDAALRELRIRLENSEREYRNSLSEYADNIEAYLLDTNIRLSELSLAPVDVRVVQFRQQEIARITHEADRALAEAEAALAALLSQTTDINRQEELKHLYEEQIAAIYRKRDAELEYADTIVSVREREMRAAHDRLREFEDMARAQDSILGGVLTELERQRLDSMDLSFQLGEEMTRRTIDGISESMARLFTDSSDNFREFLNNMSKDLANFALSSIFKKLLNDALNDSFGDGSGGGLLSGIKGANGSKSSGGLLGGLIGGITDLFGFGGGGVASSGRVVGQAYPNSLPWLSGGAPLPWLAADGGIVDVYRKFAMGGIFDRPTMFGYGNGEIGQLGEAGPEGIFPVIRKGSGYAIKGRDGTAIPVVRLPDGSLGVDASYMSVANISKRYSQGAIFDQVEQAMSSSRSLSGQVVQKGSSMQRPIQVTMNINTPDAGSFRRSKTQVLTELQQGLNKAQRNM